MRSRRKPPAAFDAARVQNIASLLTRSDVADFVATANAQYYHWDDIRYRPLPDGLTPEQAWTTIKFSRLTRKTLPLVDPKNISFSYWLPETAYQTLHLADRAGGNVIATDDGSAPFTFEEIRHRVLVDSLMEEAIASSQIEGAITTRKVAKEMLRSGRKPKDRSEQMIFNGYSTIRLVRERLHRPLDLDLINEFQRCITRDTLDDPADAGRLRREEDDVHIVDVRDNEIVYTPPPASMLPKRLALLFDFANAEPKAGQFMHPLIRAAILHFWLAYEHPFVDGNGRTARALFYWSMLKSGYWLFEFLTISRIIHASSMRYYKSFQYTESDDNDLTYFLMFQMEVTSKALADLKKRLGEMQSSEQRMQSIRLASRLNIRQRALIDHALRNATQIYTIDSHRNSHGVSIQTARTDLMDLAARGLLAEVGGRRPRQFSPVRNLAKRLRLKS